MTSEKKGFWARKVSENSKPVQIIIHVAFIGLIGSIMFEVVYMLPRFL